MCKNRGCVDRCKKIGNFIGSDSFRGDAVRKFSYRAGFTIIEMSIVLITVGLLAILAKSYLMSNVDTARFNLIRSDLDSAVEQLFRDVKNNNWRMPHPIPQTLDTDTKDGVDFIKGDQSLPGYKDSFGKEYIVYSDYAHKYKNSNPLDVCTSHHSGIGKNRYILVFPNGKELPVSLVMIPQEYKMFYEVDTSNPYKIIMRGLPGDVVKVKVDGANQDVVNNSYIKYFTHTQVMEKVSCPKFAMTPSSVVNVPLTVNPDDFEVQIRSGNSGIVDWCVEIEQSKRRQLGGGTDSSIGLRTLPVDSSLDRSGSLFDEVKASTSAQNRCPNSTFPANGFSIWFSRALPYTYNFTVYAYDNRTGEGKGKELLEKKTYIIGVINP